MFFYKTPAASHCTYVNWTFLSVACRGLCELALPVFFSSFTTVCFLLGCVPATEIFLISRLGKLVLLAGPPSPGQALFAPCACGWLLTIWALAWVVAQKSCPSLPRLRWTLRPPCLEFLFHSLRHCLRWSYLLVLCSPSVPWGRNLSVLLTNVPQCLE